jgi:hypothetical protein
MMPSGQLFFLFFFLTFPLDAFNSPLVADNEQRLVW